MLVPNIYETILGGYHLKYWSIGDLTTLIVKKRSWTSLFLPNIMKFWVSVPDRIFFLGAIFDLKKPACV